MRGWPARTPRTPRALVATLAVGALAVTGIDGPTGGADEPAPAEAVGSRWATPTPTPAYERPPGRPNILFITVDDLAFRDMEYMPATQKLLAKQGVTFDDALAPTPICVPARASLLTGQYAHNHGAVTINGPGGGYAAFEDRDTLPMAMQEAGYDTLFTGKYLNGYGKVLPGTEIDTENDRPRGWTDWRATIDPSTYRFDRRRMNINGTIARVPGYATEVMTEQAVAMIRAPREKPWFAWVNYVAPHVGGPEGDDDPRKKYAGTDADFKTTVPAPRDRGRYKRTKIPQRPYTFPENTDSLPPANRPAHRRFSDRQKSALTTVYQRRIEAARGLDRGVRELVRTLRRDRQLDRTLIVFTSDNGFSVDAHNLNGKLYHWDDSVRIPVLMRGPGLPRNRHVGTAVTNPDLAATVLGVAGAELDRDLDGVDILPWVSAPEQVRVVPIAGWPGNDGRRRFYSGVRVGPWTYVRFRRGGEELYDRRRSPYETDNLADSPSAGKVLLAMRALTSKYRTCAADECPQRFYPVAEAADPTRIPG